MLDPGETAPDFELPDHNGHTVSLSSYRGDYVVVYFYPRADTPGCTTEACGFRDAYDEFEARDVTVLGISDDPVEDIASFADDYDLPFRLLSDEDGSVSTAYDSYGEKTMAGDTFDGVFRNTYVIDPDGEIALAYEGVSPEGHAETTSRTSTIWGLVRRSCARPSSDRGSVVSDQSPRYRPQCKKSAFSASLRRPAVRRSDYWKVRPTPASGACSTSVVSKRSSIFS